MQAADYYSDRNIMVTGAGGYIGSALAKTLAGCQPRSLVLLDSCEQNLFRLRRCLGSPTNTVSILGSVEQAGLLDEIFTRFQPETVFHAAAYKHVELLELNPFAAVQNNALGTYTLAMKAIQHGCRAFVLVSTDKAVLPASIMGATKRMAEILTVSLSQPNCRMNAVRLCNVFGSTGSVVPIFQEQIAQGGPLTVTDREASRYFMPVDDAVNALLAAGAGNRGGVIFVPEAGSPVRILDLARTMMGDKHLPVEFIGLRAGEKIAEDWIGPGETREPNSSEDSLTVLRGQVLSPVQCCRVVELLKRAVAMRSAAELLAAIALVVPEYQPSDLIR